ncbi:MAG: PfkB family carbohydrate kinase [Thermoprotei archaeon]
MGLGYVCSFTVDRVIHTRGEWLQPGGPALYSALAARAMGGDPVVYSAVGFDFLGVWLDKLMALGVDVRRVARFRDALTTMFTISLRSSSRRLYAFNALRLDSYFRRVRINADHVYVSFTNGEVVSGTLSRIVRGKVVFLDLQGFMRRMDARGLVRVGEPKVSLEGVRFLKFSHDEVTNIGGLVKRGFKQGVSEILVTRGGGGAEVYTRMEKYYCPALAKPLSAKNTLGAGDVFGSVYFVSRIRGLSAREALAAASLAAASFVKRVGGLPFFELTVERDKIGVVASELVREEEYVLEDA